MSDHADAVALVRAHLGDPASSFSIGSFGAIGEFHRDLDEALDLEDPERLTLATMRGAIRVDLPADAQAVAYEQLSGRARCWQQGVVFCLPEERGRSNAASVLRELGPDRDAIREQDRDAILFDLGLRAANMDFCVRSKDPDLLAVLREALGQDLLTGPNAALSAIKELGPHRVARSRLGRIEVFQAISRTKTPEGPHTHLLPKLITQGRTHSAKTPVPGGTLPCLSLYPSNPLSDALGNPKPFAGDDFERFQRLLRRWAPVDYLQQKQRLENAVSADERPEGFELPGSRLGRAAVRIALRQRTWTHGDEERTWAWWKAFDGRRAPCDEDLETDLPQGPAGNR